MAELIPGLNPIGTPTYLQSGLASRLPDVLGRSQYGVQMPMAGVPGVLASSIGSAGLGLLGGGLNFAGQLVGQYMQNRQQENFYNEHLSPEARMREMAAAGINPNAAAQGVSGSSAPSMQAAALPASSNPDLANMMAQSKNTDLQNRLISANTRRTDNEADYFGSLDVEKQITNRLAGAVQEQTLYNLEKQGKILKENAYQLSIDSFYKGGEAEAHYLQSLQALQLGAAQLKNLGQEYYNLLAQEVQAYAAAGLSDAQAKKALSDIGVNNAMIEKLFSESLKLDAETLATYQGIDESKARTRLTNLKADYDEKVLQVWNDSGYNMNSSVNANYISLMGQGKTDQAQRVLDDLGAVVTAQGNARFRGRDFKSQRNRDVTRMVIGGIETVVGLGLTVSGVGVAPGAALMVHGASQFKSKSPNYSNDDGYDFSHIQ